MMNKTWIFSTGLLLALLLALMGESGVAQEPAPLGTPLDTGFTYQGQLEHDGEPVQGDCQMAFRLYDAATGGLQVGPTLTETVAVREGLFTQLLDFGAGAFTGEARWLGIQVMCSGDMGYADLGRQALTAVPYAHYALDAERLGGQDASAFAPVGHTHATLTAGQGLTGSPYDGSVARTFNVGAGSGISVGATIVTLGPLTRDWNQTGAYNIVLDHADSELRIRGSGGAFYGTFDVGNITGDETYTFTAGGSVWTSGNHGTGSGLDADLLDGHDSSSFQRRVANVVIVAQSGGDFTAIQDALDSITDASDANRYLVRVMPGVYTETVTMKPYVDIEGSGELVTRITFTGSGSGNTGTVVGADDAELRSLTVENTGGNTSAIAIYNSSVAPRLTHVTANASGGSGNYSVYNSSSSPTMTNVTASASGGSSVNYGVFNYESSPTMTNVAASASGGNNSYGVYNSSSSPTMTNVTASASGGTLSYGVHNHHSSPMMTNVTATASGGYNSYGVYNASSSPTIHNSTIRGSGGTSGSYGIYNVAPSGSHTVRVDNSQVTGSTNTIYNTGSFTTLIGVTLLDGGAVTGGGTVTCAGVYDENYVFYASTCP